MFYDLVDLQNHCNVYVLTSLKGPDTIRFYARGKFFFQILEAMTNELIVNQRSCKQSQHII